MWVEFDHFSELLSRCLPGYWCCSSVKQDKQSIKSKKDEVQTNIKSNEHGYDKTMAYHSRNSVVPGSGRFHFTGDLPGLSTGSHKLCISAVRWIRDVQSLTPGCHTNTRDEGNLYSEQEETS